jgi:hypothetical protein
MPERFGEYFYDDLLWKNRIRTELYQDGYNYVPIVFLNEENKYGERTSEETIKIYVEDYYRINGSIRNKICFDIEYKKELFKKIWEILYSFENMLELYVKNVINITLDQKAWTKICEKHVELLTLVELNYCLPTRWINEQLHNITSEKEINFSNLAFSEIIPYTIKVRLEKLKLCISSFNGNINNAMLTNYLDNICYLDNEFKQDNDILIDEIANMVYNLCNNINKEDAEKEINHINIFREKARIKHINLLLFLGKEMVKKNIDLHSMLNLSLIFNLISLVSTEEEYRHILQAKFFYYTNKLLRKLQLPIDTSTIDDVYNALK